MGEDIYIDLNYLGLSLGEGLQILEFTASQAYLQHPSPMPVGSELVLRAQSGVDFTVRVSRVHEKVTGSDRVPGMMVTPLNLQGESLEWWDERVASAPEPESESPSGTPSEVPESGSAAEPMGGSHEPEVKQSAAEESGEQTSRDTIVMDAVVSQEPGSEQAASEQPASENSTSRKNSDTIVMDAVSPDMAPPDAVPPDAVSPALGPETSDEAGAQPVGKKSKKKRRSRRKNR